MNRLRARVLCTELAVHLLCGHRQDIILRIPVSGKEVVHIILHGVRLILFRSVVPVQVLENSRISAAGNEGGVANVVHIPDGIIRAGNEVDEGLRRLLLRRVISNSALEHHPSVKINVRALLRDRKIQLVIILVRLVHRINRIARPLVVGQNLSGDHIRLSGIGLERIHVVLHGLQPVLHPCNHLRRGIVHHVLQLLLIIRIIDKVIGGEQVMLQCADRGKIALAHAVLNRHPALEIRIVQNRPGRSLFLRDLLRIIDNSGHAPHVASRIIGPGLPVDVLGFEDVLQIRRNSVDVVIVRIRLVKKVIRERNQPVLADQLHEHVFRRADKIKGIPQSQHVVEIFIGAEGGIFNIHLDAIGFLVPLLKVLDHTVLADDISARKINRLILAPVTGVNVLFPVADAKRDRLR